MKKPTLTIDLSVGTLVGCVDILEGFGQPIYGKDFSALVTEVLNGIILGYQKDGQIPIYKDEAALGTRFLAVLEDLGTLPETNQRYIQEADVDTALKEIRRREDEDIENQLASIRQPLLPPNTTSTTSTEGNTGEGESREKNEGNGENEGEEDSTKSVSFDNIPDKDPLKQKASTDIEKAALSFVYTNIPHELWGTDKADGFWRKAVRNFEKKQQGTPQV